MIAAVPWRCEGQRAAVGAAPRVVFRWRSISSIVRGVVADRRLRPVSVSTNETSTRTPIPLYFCTAAATAPSNARFSGVSSRLSSACGRRKSPARRRTSSPPRAASDSRPRRARPCRSSDRCRRVPGAELAAGRVRDEPELQQPRLDDGFRSLLDVRRLRANLRRLHAGFLRRQHEPVESFCASANVPLTG